LTLTTGWLAYCDAPKLVMAGLDPGIHVSLALSCWEAMDRRVKPGDDNGGLVVEANGLLPTS